jgi:hypothetical protein
MKPIENSSLRGNYVLLTADTLHLLLPQHDIGAAEYLEGIPEAGDEPGLLKIMGTEGPRHYAALSSQMVLLQNCPTDRFLATPLGESNNDLLWCWNEVRILIDVELQLNTIPAVLLTPGTPVNQYVELDDKLAYLCSANQLIAFAFAKGIR